MDRKVVLRISDNDGVNLDGVNLRSACEVAEALNKICAENFKVTVSIEATDSIYYESIGKAIYGCRRAGCTGERLHILVDGKHLNC